MRLVSYTIRDQPRIGLARNERVIDARAALTRLLARNRVHAPDSIATALCPGDLTQALAIGTPAIAAWRAVESFMDAGGDEALTDDERPWFDELNLLPAVPNPSKIYCVGVNNRELTANLISGPTHPIYFSKPPSALVAHGAPIEIMDIGAVHLEAELAVVIGRPARDVSEADAYDYVFGYTIFNDVTAVDVREEDTYRVGIPTRDADGAPTVQEDTFTPIARHKGMDTFAPLGPWIVTRDEIPDPHALSVKAWMGEHLVNDGTTADLTYQIPSILAWISRHSTLLPGDIVSIGTAPSTTEWPMKDADIGAHGEPVRIDIQHVGALVNPIVRV